MYDARLLTDLHSGLLAITGWRPCGDAVLLPNIGIYSVRGPSGKTPVPAIG
jgi:hypothetical protein